MLVPNTRPSAFGHLSGYVPFSIAASYVVIHAALMFLLIGVVRSDPTAQRAVPVFVAAFYTLALQIGHVVEWTMCLVVVTVALAVWRRSRVSREDAWVVARGIGYSHVPLVLWVVVVAAIWLPASVGLARQGLSPVAMAQNSAWLDIAAKAFLARYAANAAAVISLAWLIGRHFSLGVKGSISVIVMPMIGLGLVSHLVAWLLAS